MERGILSGCVHGSGEMSKLNKVGAMKLKTATPGPQLLLPNGGSNPAGEAHVCSSSLLLTSCPISDFGMARLALIGLRIKAQDY